MNVQKDAISQYLERCNIKSLHILKIVKNSKLTIFSVTEVILYIWVHKLVHSLTEKQFASFYQIFKCAYFAHSYTTTTSHMYMKY